MFYVGDNVAPVLSRRRILWVEAFAQGCSDGICANTQGHITRCARARGLAQFAGTYMLIRCSRSAVLQPPGRTPAMVARGTQAFCLVRAMPFAPSMACPARGRSAPFLGLRAVPWRTILSYASLPCRRNGLHAWRPARLLLGDVWLSSSSVRLTRITRVTRNEDTLIIIITCCSYRFRRAARSSDPDPAGCS